MPTIPCPISTPCLNPANPITNYSSEAPDQEVFLGFGSTSLAQGPNIGDPFTNPGGYYYCESVTSQEAAQLCADNGALDNGADGGGTSGDPPPNTGGDPGNWGSQLFWNSTQVASVNCPDGSVFSYTMPAMSVRSTSPTLADRIALSIATIRANRFLICISNIAGACLGEEYDQLVTATTSQDGDVTWLLVSGMLPPGLLIDFDLFNSRQINIIGTPTAAGNYTFVLRATDSLGNFTDKTVVMAVMGFTNAPTQATVNTPYSFQFTAAGGTAPYFFSVPPGNLPAGLTMSDSGLISGTPTDDTPTTFTVSLEDANGLTCGKQFTMTPMSGDTCVSIIAGLGWAYQNDPNNALAGWSMTAGAGSFAQRTIDGNFGTFSIATTTVTNNTAAPITIRFTCNITSSANVDLDQFIIFDNFTSAFVINQPWPFTGILTGDVTIQPGDSHVFDMNSSIADDMAGISTASGTVTITCV